MDKKVSFLIIMKCVSSQILLAEKVTFWGEKKDYYHYLTENVDGLKSLDQVIKKVQALTEVQEYTDIHCKYPGMHKDFQIYVSVLSVYTASQWPRKRAGTYSFLSK